MKSSTFHRIRRIFVALIIISIWQFLAIPIVYHMMEINSWRSYYGTEPPFYEWAAYAQDFGTPVSAFYGIAAIQIAGLLATALVFALLYIIWGVVSYIWYGSSDDETPECTNPNCPCTWHKGEVFEDGEWVIQDCTNPHCTCTSHTNERFSTKKGKWVEE